MASKKNRRYVGIQRLDRPPRRLYVKLDELGPHLARARKVDAIAEATDELEQFGEGRIYEYRLVSKSPRAIVRTENGGHDAG